MMMIIIIIMKTFSRRSSHGHHGSKPTNWRNTHTHVDRLHSLTHFTSTQFTTMLCEAPAHLLQNLESNSILKVAEGGGANRSNQRKTLTACLLIGITYLEEKIQHPGRESNPHPPTLVISSLQLSTIVCSAL